MVWQLPQFGLRDHMVPSDEIMMPCAKPLVQIKLDHMHCSYSSYSMKGTERQLLV